MEIVFTILKPKGHDIRGNDSSVNASLGVFIETPAICGFRDDAANDDSRLFQQSSVLSSVLDDRLADQRVKSEFSFQAAKAGKVGTKREHHMTLEFTNNESETKGLCERQDVGHQVCWLWSSDLRTLWSSAYLTAVALSPLSTMPLLLPLPSRGVGICQPC